MDAKSLQQEADKIRANIASKQSQANRFMQDAVGHNQQGDAQKVAVDEARADQLNEEARQMEEKALELERQAMLQINKANDIEKEQEQLRADFDQKMQNLEHEKRDLAGGPGSLI